MKKYLRAILILISAVILIGTNAAGCKSSVTHTAATVTISNVSLSFEFPAEYAKLEPDVYEGTGNSTMLVLLYYDKRPDEQKVNREIVIVGLNPMPTRIDATAWAEKNLEVLMQGDAKFKLYERSPIQVSGINGVMTAYHTSILGSFLNSDDVMYRDVYVDYQGKIWKIALLATEDVADEAGADFDRLISSFKFLD